MKFFASLPRYAVPIFLVLFFSLGTIWALLAPGTFSVHDSMHRAWIFEMSRNFTNYQFPPQWAPDLSWGYGYPYFYYFYPLPYYLGATLYLLGLNLSQSFDAIQLIAILGSAIAMYFYAGQRSRLAGIVAAVVYIYAPYRAVNTYVRGALGESFVYLWVPLALYAIDRMRVDSQKKRYWVLGIFSVSGLVLSHNIGAVIFLPIIALYFLLSSISATSKQKYRSLSSIILGLTLSAYFWLPALFNKHLIKEEPTYQVVDHFPFLYQLVKPFWGYGISTWGPYDGMSFQIGIVNILLLTILGVYIVFQILKKSGASWQLYFTIAVSGVALFMMNIRSLFIWENFPLLNLLQFPWRFLAVLVLMSALAAGYLIPKVSSKFARVFISILIIGATILSTHQYFKPDKSVFISDEEVIDRYFPNDPRQSTLQLSKEYLNQQEEYLPLPLTVQERPTSFTDSQFRSTKSTISIISSSPFEHHLQIDSLAADIVTASIYAFPGWKVNLNGQNITYSVLNPYGEISFPVPHGRSIVTIKYSSSGWSLIANWISIITLTTILIVLSNRKFKLNLK